MGDPAWAEEPQAACLAEGGWSLPGAESLVDPEDPNQVASFLGKRFSALIDQVRLAEDAQAEAERELAAMGIRLKETELRKRASGLQLQAALRLSRDDAERLGQRLWQARARAASAADGLRRARAASGALSARVGDLEARQRELQHEADDAQESVSQTDRGRLAHEAECGRLRAEADRRAAELRSAEVALAAGQEQAQQRRQRLAALEEQLAGAQRARQAAGRRAESRLEEIADAERQAALAKERLAGAERALEEGREEVQQGAVELGAARDELRRWESQAAARGRELVRLGEAKAELADALRESVAAAARTEAVKHFLLKTREVGADIDARRTQKQAELDAQAERLSGARAELERGRADLEALRSSLEKARSRRAELEAEEAPLAARSASLKEELRRAFAAVEHARAERDEAGAAAEQALRRLGATEPALETARQRVRELEASVQESAARAAQARRQKEALAAEVRSGRDRAHGLRQRRSGLQEQLQALEKRLMRTARRSGFAAGARASAPGPAAGRGPRAPAAPSCARGAPAAAARGAPGADRPRARSDGPPPPPGGSPRGVAAGQPGADQLGAATGAAGGGAEAAAEAGGARGVGYLRQWVALEEARLSAPRQPTPAGRDALGHGAVGSPRAQGSPGRSRSAAALVALTSGAPMPQVLALALGEGSEACGAGSP